MSDGPSPGLEVTHSVVAVAENNPESEVSSDGWNDWHVVEPNTYAATIGDGVNTSYTVTHNLGTTDVQIAVYRVSDGVKIMVGARPSGANAVVITFGVAPAVTYRVVVSK